MEERAIKAPESTRLRLELPSGTAVTTFVIPKVTHTPLMSARRRLVDDGAMDVLQSGSPLFECHVPTLLKGLAVKPHLESVTCTEESIDGGRKIRTACPTRASERLGRFVLQLCPRVLVQ